MPRADETQPDFGQHKWHVEGGVCNIGQVNFPGGVGDPSRSGPLEGPVPPPPDGPEFRRALARLLLRKLTSTLDEMHWLDDTLVDLSVSVEDVDGHPFAGHRGLRLRRRGRTGARPLSEVLADPETDLILLQGEAGSGKSVALRQHAMNQLEHITEGRAPAETPLPLYVNLRELRARPDEINTTVLRRYIMEQTAPRGSTDVAAYFTHCFAEDLRHRRVTLLLDSFDEIPAVYGSPTIDAAAWPYVQTVIELVGGGGRCVVAAREYKGPRASGWTRLQLLGLSPQQQEEFLRRLRLDSDRVSVVQTLLTDPRRGFATALRNPLHLRLLAGYVQNRNAVPDRPSALFAQYASLRLREALSAMGTDLDSAGRTTAMLGRSEDFLARFAFLLTASDAGLSMDERSYRREILQDAGGDAATAELMARALARSRILVSSLVATAGPTGGAGAGNTGGRRVFFGHRRILEYFASRYVAGHPSVVPLRELAMNGRWRETAVTVLQDGSLEATVPLLETLGEVLTAERDHAGRPETVGFEWSPEAVHCLGLLTAAYQGRAEWPQQLIRPQIEDLVATAWERGSVSDRKLALDCLPLLSEEVRQTYIDLAFAGDSDWIRRTALRDCATLPSLSPAVQASIRRLLITRLGERTSAAEAHALDIDLQRLRASDDLLALRRLLDLLPRRVGWLCGISLMFMLVGDWHDGLWWMLPRFFAHRQRSAGFLLDLPGQCPVVLRKGKGPAPQNPEGRRAPHRRQGHLGSARVHHLPRRRLWGVATVRRDHEPGPRRCGTGRSPVRGSCDECLQPPVGAERALRRSPRPLSAEPRRGRAVRARAEGPPSRGGTEEQFMDNPGGNGTRRGRIHACHYRPRTS